MIEYLIDLYGSYTPTMFVEFVVFGLILNLIGWGISSTVTVNKLSELSNSDKFELQRFIHLRDFVIRRQNSIGKRLLNSMLVFLPGYNFGLNIVYAYHLTKNDGLIGIINAVIESEKYAIINLVQYDIVKTNNK